MQFFHVRRDRAVGDIEALGKIGKIELAFLQQLVQDTESHIGIERFV